MRIEAYNQVQALYQTQKTKATQKSASVSKGTDQLQISSIGKDIQTAKAAVSGASDIREDLTASIKQQVQDGSYSVDTESFASKLLAKYQEGLF